MENYFIELNNVNVNQWVEKKNNLSYVSWANAWAEVKKKHPNATYTIYENADGWNYHTDGKTGWVKTGVTVNGIEHIEYLPIMDFRNASIKLENITSFDVNKAIQRSLTKACARHGLGLYIYAGEDLPEEEKAEGEKEKAEGEKEIADLKEKVIDNVKADAMISAFKAAKMSTDEIKDVLKKHGYTKVIDVKVKDYASVMADIKA